MYKFKIINYKPYEYKLFQEKLNTLGKEGYKCLDLSLISVFKKTNHPIFYKIDFFKPSGDTRVEKINSRERFFYPYLDKDFTPIYHKKGMYVFMGEKDENIKRIKHIQDDVSKVRTKAKYFGCFAIAIMLSAFFIFGTLSNSTIDSFLTYGSTFAFIGAILFAGACIYRTFVNFKMMCELIKNEKEFSKNQEKIQKLRMIYRIVLCISLILIIGGLGEDIVNAKSFSPQDHSVLTLKDLDIQKESNTSYQEKSSFKVPHSYTTLETTQDDVLYIQEYYLRNEQSAKKLFNDFKNNPVQVSLSRIEEREHILYGYNNDLLTTLIIQKDHQVTIVSVTFSLNQKQINTIIDQYK